MVAELLGRHKKRKRPSWALRSSGPSSFVGNAKWLSICALHCVGLWSSLGGWRSFDGLLAVPGLWSDSFGMALLFLFLDWGLE